jgi:hypothetical protein
LLIANTIAKAKTFVKANLGKSNLLVVDNCGAVVFYKIGNRMGLLVVVVDSRTASMWLKTSDRNECFARFGSPDTEPTTLVFATNRVALFIRFHKLE